MELTDKQSLILEWIKDRVAAGCTPTINEVAARFAMSTNGAQDHLKALERKGAIAREAGRARSIIIDLQAQVDRLSR